MIIRTDLHLHSCVSPCGDLSMSPRAMAKILRERGIRLAALTDHNTARNCPAFGVCCRDNGVVPLFGIEAQGQEESHTLCLFSELDAALTLGEEIYRLMPPIMNVPEKMGDQVYVDENDNILGEVDKFLITSANISLNELAARVISLGGIVIPAHINRPAFSLSSQLGFIPDGPWSALEIVQFPGNAELSVDTRGYPLITSSDAHYPEHIAERAFDLDIKDEALTLENGRANLQTIIRALDRRPRS